MAVREEGAGILGEDGVVLEDGVLGLMRGERMEGDMTLSRWEWGNGVADPYNEMHKDLTLRILGILWKLCHLVRKRVSLAAGVHWHSPGAILLPSLSSSQGWRKVGVMVVVVVKAKGRSAAVLCGVEMGSMFTTRAHYKEKSSVWST